MLITNLKKYIVFLDATTKYRDMYYVEWAEKPAAHDMVKKFIIGISNTHCGMGLNPRPDTVFRHLRSDRGGGATPLAFPNEAS